MHKGQQWTLYDIRAMETTKNNLRQHGEGLLYGDFNSRISVKPGMI